MCQAEPPRKRAVHASVTVADLIRDQGKFNTLADAPNDVVLEALDELLLRQGQFNKARTFASHLLQSKFGINATGVYNALIATNWDPNGSADDVDATLRTMSEHKIEKTSQTYHNALWALVNHPDYLCRNRVLEEMRNGWIDLTDDGKCAVALGLLRDGQVELASEELEKMIRVGTDVPSWVWDVFVFCFLRYGFVNEALTLTRQRLDMVGSATAIPLGTWHFLLDACAEAQHYEGARLLWQRFVRPGILQPSDGTTMSMINTASRNMDPELATEAIQVLATRGVNLGLHHYEPLIECYTTAGDIGNALRALSIMAEAEMQPDRASTRSIYLLLRASPSRTEEAIAVLTELSKERGMPITALNVVLEALYHQEDSARAVDLYRQVRDICPEGPDMHTFEILLSRPISEKLADFIASEMSAFSIRPNCTMYDNLVCSHGKDGDLETAMRYVWKLGNELARSGGFLKEENWLSKRTLQVLLRRLFLEADARLWALVDEAKRRGVLVDEDVQKIISGALLEVDADAEAAGRQDAVLEALPESRPPGALLAQ